MKRRFSELGDPDEDDGDAHGRPRGRTIGFTDQELESRFSQGTPAGGTDENLMDEAAARRMIRQEREEALMDEATKRRTVEEGQSQELAKEAPEQEGPRPVAGQPLPAAAEPEVAAIGKGLVEGGYVTLLGLQKAKELNGMSGRLDRWDASSSRWDVRLPDGDVKAIKPENLMLQAHDPGEAPSSPALWAPPSPDRATLPSSPRAAGAADAAPGSPPLLPSSGVAGLSSTAFLTPPPAAAAAPAPRAKKPKTTRRLGTIRWYNGRRRLGSLIPDDVGGRERKDLFIPAQGAPNGSMVPPQPGGLFHGTRVSFQPAALNPSSTDSSFGSKREKEIICMDVRPLSGQTGLSVGVDTQDGAKETNDDRVAASDLQELGFFAAVFDGHRGPHCADYLAKQLPNMLLQSYRARMKREGGITKMTHAQEAMSISKSFADAFEKTDEAFMVAARKKDIESGSTAICALVCHGFEVPPLADSSTLGVAHLWPKPDPSSKQAERNPGTVARALGGVAKLFIAWCGDSRAIIIRGRQGIRCTEDHRPSRRDELARIKSAGGFVAQDGYGIWRVGRREESKLARELEKRRKVEPSRMRWFLSTSRSFGDTGLKQPDPIIIATPEVKVIDLVPEDWAVVLGSDGCFDRLTDQKIADILWKAMAVQGKDPVAAAKTLTQTAIAAGSRDNCTAVVMRLGWAAPPMPADSPAAAGRAGLDQPQGDKQDEFNMFG